MLERVTLQLNTSRVKGQPWRVRRRTHLCPTFRGEVGCEPIALTMATFPVASGSISIISLLAPAMRSAAAMQVPPNLCTLQPSPRSKVDTADSALAGADALQVEAKPRADGLKEGEGSLGA